MNTVRENDIKQIGSIIPYEAFGGETFLITGATGFIASHIVDTLMYLNYRDSGNKCKVIALCRNREKAERVFKDYLNQECFQLVVQGLNEAVDIQGPVDYIFHAASNAVTSTFTKIPADTLCVNMIGTYNLLELAKEKNSKSFLFLSSGAVYGDVPKEIQEIREESVFPINFSKSEASYAVGKVAGEALCKAYWNQHNVPAKVVRISHTYGPGINLDDGRVFSDFVSQICKKQSLVIKGTGNDVRPFCYITDAIAAFFLVLFKGENGESYNMANRRETYTIRELAEILVNEAFPERNLKIEHKNYSVKNDMLNKQKVDISKLQRLGWNPQIDVVEGFRRTVASFEEE